MWILNMINCSIPRSGNLRASLLIVFGLLLVCFTDLAGAACDCETECSCSKSNCTAGEYWSGTGCVECPAGHFCLGNETAPQPCPEDTENPNTGATNSSACTACASGLNSTAGSISCDVPCPAGYDCTTSPGNVTLCAAGTYSNYGEGICRSCPSDKVCPDPSQQPQYCPGGYQPDVFQTKCDPCEAGKFSFNGTSCQACATGSYSLGGAAECTVCPAGHQCSNQTIDPVRCNPGEYAPAGETNCTLCEKGFRCPDVPLASPLPCFNGTYTDAVGQTECKLCTAGNFCPFASQGEQPCENGTYSKNGSSVCTECPGGHSCADPSADPVQCQNGTYAPSGSLACLPCPEGAQCLTPGLSEYIPCHGGTYLLTDANNVTSCQSCPPGKRCPNPNQAPEDCPDGTYSKGGTVACTVCPGGHRWVFKFR